MWASGGFCSSVVYWDLACFSSSANLVLVIVSLPELGKIIYAGSDIQSYAHISLSVGICCLYSRHKSLVNRDRPGAVPWPVILI